MLKHISVCLWTFECPVLPVLWRQENGQFGLRMQLDGAGSSSPQGEKMGFQLHDEWPLLALALFKPEQAAADQQFITDHAPDPALKKYTVAVAHSQT